MLVQIKDDTGEVVAVIPLDQKTFSSGKQGFWGNGKVGLNGNRYQAQAQLVKIEKK